MIETIIKLLQKEINNISDRKEPNKEISIIQEKINKIDLGTKPVEEMSGEELLEYYNKRWNKRYLESEIAKILAKENGCDLFVDFICPPSTVEQALKCREFELEPTRFDESDIKAINEALKEMWDNN